MQRNKHRIDDSVPKFYIETSVHYNRIFGTKRQKEAIHEKVPDGSKISSSVYALKEFHGIFTIPLIYLCYFINNSDSVEEAIKEFRNAYPFSNRKKNILIDYSATLVESLIAKVKDISNRDRAIGAIKDHIYSTETTIWNWVNSGWIDNLQLGQSVFRLTSYSSLSKFKDYYENFDDKFPYTHFLLHKHDSLQLLLDFNTRGLKGPRSDIKKEFNQKLKPLYSQLINGDSLDGPTITKKLGDTLILFECPKSHSLVTFDQIFYIIAGATQKKYIVISQPKSLQSADGFWDNNIGM